MVNVCNIKASHRHRSRLFGFCCYRYCRSSRSSLCILDINSYQIHDLLLFSCSVMSNFLRPHGLQNARLPCPSPSPRGCSNSCPLSQWCHPTHSSFVFPFSSWLHSFPASGSFPMSQLFTSGGQSIGTPASASVLPMNIQGWFPLGWTGCIFLVFRGLSRVFSSTMVWKHQFFTVQLSYPYMTIGKTIALTIRFCFCLGWPSLAFFPQYLSHTSSFWAQNSVFLPIDSQVLVLILLWNYCQILISSKYL